LQNQEKQDNKIGKELRQIRNVLVLIAIKSGATSEEVGTATGIGGGNVRALLSTKGKKKKK
jgi:hypothetical protein